jgi:uncharacterized lipoprotein YehR (DUF1307 family)
MKKSKKIITILFSLFLTIALSGCGTANIGMNTTLNEDGSGTFSLKLATTGIFAQSNPSSDTTNKDNSNDTKNKLFNSALNDIPSNQYKDGDKNIDEKTINFKNVKELNDLFKDAKDSDLTVNITENKQLFKTTYVYTMKLPKEFSMKSMTTEIEKNQDSAQSMGITNEQILSFLGQAISLSTSVSLPGKIVSQNATSTNGNILKWDYALSQINPDNVMTATCEVMNKTNISIASGIGILLLIIAALVIVKKVKKKNNNE